MNWKQIGLTVAATVVALLVYNFVIWPLMVKIAARVQK